MKATSVSEPRAESFLSDFFDLTKARLSFLVLVTTLAGFLLAWQGPFDYLLLTATLVGTALSACGAGALNQWLERDVDALMKRTRNRPLPGGRMHHADAFLLGFLFSVSGTVCLFLFANWMAGLLSIATLVSYLLIYTPMKRVSAMNTLVGAVPGALPPLIGWTAARGDIGPGGFLLFAILWFWQMPHFLAISWMYREDYAQAGFKMLSSMDETGDITARQALLYSLALLAVSLAPVLLGLVTPLYFLFAFVLGVIFAGLAVRFLLVRTRANARLLFFGSILYLPLLLGFLLAFKA